MSEKFYDKFFSKLIKNEDIDKIRRFTIYKIIPEFIKIVSSSKFELSQRVFETMAIFTQDPALAYKNFIIYREKKKSNNGGGSEFDGDTSRSASYSESEYSTSSAVDSKHFDLDVEFCAETYKNFLLSLNYLQLYFMKIQMKLSKLTTSEFELILIEIISFGEI